MNNSVINMNVFLQSCMWSLQVMFYVIGEITSSFFSMSCDWKPSNWGKVEESEIAEKLKRMPSINNCRRRHTDEKLSRSKIAFIPNYSVYCNKYVMTHLPVYY